MASESSFEWDEKKNIENQIKHGVSFYKAQFAFADENRVILEDISHSRDEIRYYCLGKTGGGTLTVRFTYRKKKIRIIGAGYWRKGKKSMKNKIKYSNEEIGEVRVVRDFLPSPKELAYKENTVKVTIALSKSSIEFFKNESKKYNTPYQKMIRNLLDEYVGMHKTI